jgi:uncharacterized repeat protein (TIGR01451 family)
MRQRGVAIAVVVSAVLVALALDAATSAAQEPLPHADLAIASNTPNVTHARVGQDVTFTIVARNNGPDPAIVYVNISLETSLTYEGKELPPGALEITGGECDQGVSGDGVYCEYGVIEPGETLTQTFVGQVRPGTNRAVNTACIPSWLMSADDPNQANDCLAATVKVIGRGK